MKPDEWLEMVTDPRMALCDPVIISRLISAKNMTNGDIQVSVRSALWREKSFYNKATKSVFKSILQFGCRV